MRLGASVTRATIEGNVAIVDVGDPVSDPDAGLYSAGFVVDGNRNLVRGNAAVVNPEIGFVILGSEHYLGGNLASLTDPVQNTTHWSYDDQNCLTQETNASGDSRYYTYDAAGDLVRYVGEQTAYDLAQHHETMEDIARNSVSLERAGVGQIEVSGICTACHTQDWISHRAEKGRTGRFGALISLQ